MTRLAAAAVLLIGATAAAAADPGGLAYAPPPTPPAPDPAGLLLRLGGMTAAVLVLCGAILWVARAMQRTAGPADPSGRLRVEGSVALDRRCTVHMLKADGCTVAVATDSSGLKSVLVLSEPFEQALAAAAEEPAVKRAA